MHHGAPSVALLRLPAATPPQGELQSCRGHGGLNPGALAPRGYRYHEELKELDEIWLFEALCVQLHKLYKLYTV